MGKLKVIRLRPILAAIALAATRGARSLRHVSGNNLVYAGVTLTFMLDPGAMVFLLTLIAIVLFLPSSSDPLTAVPRDRIELWPLRKWELRALRLLTPFLNPLTWLILATLVWKRLQWGLWAALATAFLTGFLSSHLRLPHPPVPRIPAGRITYLLRKDLRQMLTALDVYCALLIAAPAAYFRFTSQLPAEAHIPLTGLIVLILSTIPLTLFGLDGDGLTRYRLLPCSAVLPVSVKGLSFVFLTLFLTLPLAPIPALGGALMALAVGQYHSFRRPTPQARWAFRSSAPFAYSMAEMGAAITGFAAVAQLGPLLILPCATIYAASLAATVRPAPTPASQKSPAPEPKDSHPPSN
ncbi:MAG: hypothetical protein U0R19_07185 [Bryobacteraceae bacterium]